MVLQRSFSDVKKRTDLQWFTGLCIASCFSLVYYLAPFYMLSSILVLLMGFPTPVLSWLYVAPIFVSALVPTIPSPSLLALLKPMANYFEYEEIHETSPRDVWTEVRTGKSNFLVVKQPHGALSFTGMMSAVMAPDEMRGIVPTAVADALLVTPILKHVMGIFGLISASKHNMIKTLKRKGAAGTVVLYVGGMAELFLSCESEEKLYLKKRKGFIKLALTQGVDIVPVYLFGNTNVLSVWKTGILATLSRRLQVSLTYMWGKWGLPIPRDCKLLYVTGQPLGLPHIEKPTQEDIDKYHQLYCDQVTRLFEKYKEKVPEYKHKKLEIV